MKWRIVIDEETDFPGKTFWSLDVRDEHAHWENIDCGKEDGGQLAYDQARLKLDKLLAKQS